MAPDRFDDVDIRFLDEPEPERRPPSLRKRMTVALSAWILAAGVLAAGASALTGSEGAAAAGGGSGASGAQRNAEGVPFKRDGRECRGKDKGRSSSSSASGASASDF